MLFLGLLFNHLVIGWWGLSHEKERCSHTHTHVIFPDTTAFVLMVPAEYISFSDVLYVQLWFTYRIIATIEDTAVMSSKIFQDFKVLTSDGSLLSTVKNVQITDLMYLNSTTFG